MLGRVRRSSISSLEQLELERQSPKLMKSDSLSIYETKELRLSSLKMYLIELLICAAETTLLKLKEGSRRDISTCLEDSKGEEASSAIDVDSSSCDSTEDSQRQQRRTGKFSLPYLFLRYRSSRQAVSSPDEDSCSSASTSPCHSIVQSSS